MLAYLVHRRLLMIPTLFGIIVINFVVIQAAPGGPVEQTLAQLQGNDVSATARISGAGAAEAGALWERHLTAAAPPSRQDPLGTDDQARDVLARVVYGFRVSIMFARILTVLSSLIGVAAGVVQGYFGGWVDLGFQRFIEIWGGVPTLYLLMILSSLVRTTFWVLLGFLLLFGWMGLVGLVRAEVLRARNFEFVRAARALGVRDHSIMLRHILPKALVATLLPFVLVGAVGTLASLDFLSFGLSAGAPSLGGLLNQEVSFQIRANATCRRPGSS